MMLAETIQHCLESQGGRWLFLPFQVGILVPTPLWCISSALSRKTHLKSWGGNKGHRDADLQPLPCCLHGSCEGANSPSSPFTKD